MRKIIIILLMLFSLSFAFSKTVLKSKKIESSKTENITYSTSYFVSPILTRVEHNAVIKITLKRSGGENYLLRLVKLSLRGSTAIDDIESVSLFVADSLGTFNADNQFGKSVKPAKEITFKSILPIYSQEQSLWVCVHLKPRPELTHKLNISCVEIGTNFGHASVLGVVSANNLRLGVALRMHNDDGVHTFRIPGLITTKKGTIVALYDARRDMPRDLQGNIDIAINRSFDEGKTWQPMQIVLDMKKWGGLPEKYNGVSDANILVDDKTGELFVAGLWMHGLLDSETGKYIEGLNDTSSLWSHQWMGKGSQPGTGEKETSQFIISRSADDGKTWSLPLNITAQVKNNNWWLFCPAPGHGITMDDGTLVFPTQGRDANGVPFSNIMYSKDNGNNWTVSNPAYSGVNECMAVELSDHSIMLNMRDARNNGNTRTNGRVICITRDLGKTWTEHPTSRKALIEPACMASIHKYTYINNGKRKTMLLFVNPNSVSERNNITLKVSFDDGTTWPKDKWILLDQGIGRGYSCITTVNGHTIGILYESSEADMVFQKIDVKELL